MQDLLDTFVVDLLEDILKNNADYYKIPMVRFKNALGEPSTLITFNKTEIPFEFADPVTPEKIHSIEDMINPLRQEISEGILSDIPDEVMSAIEKKYAKFNFGKSFKETLTNIYLMKICSEHVELMWTDKLSAAKKNLINSVIIGKIQTLKVPKKNTDKLLDSPKSPRSKIITTKNKSESFIYKYIEERDISTLNTFSFFNEIKDNDQFIKNLGENSLKLFENKKWREELAPPYTVNSVKSMLNIINGMRNEFLKKNDCLDLLDTKMENLSNTDKISVMHYFMGSYALKAFSLALTGHPKASNIMHLFLCVYPSYDHTNPEQLHQEITQKIAKQHTNYFYNMVHPDSDNADSDFDSDSDDDDNDTKKNSTLESPNPGMLFHAINEIVKSEHFLYTEKSILESLEHKDVS
jgi:hypothetical protein